MSFKSLAISAAGFVLTTLASMAFDGMFSFDWLTSSASRNPASFALFSVGILFLGVAIGSLVSGRSYASENDDLKIKCDELTRENVRLNGRVRSLESENESPREHMGRRKGEVPCTDDGPVGSASRDPDARLDVRKVPSGMRAAIDGIAKAAASLSDSVGPEASSQKGGGPLSVLVPAEIPFLLRVYDEAQAHVGAENLAVARSLHGKGAVLRTDAPESGVISQCDVTLAPEWVPIMRARADELRAELE